MRNRRTEPWGGSTAIAFSTHRLQHQASLWRLGILDISWTSKEYRSLSGCHLHRSSTHIALHRPGARASQKTRPSIDPSLGPTLTTSSTQLHVFVTSHLHTHSARPWTSQKASHRSKSFSIGEPSPPVPRGPLTPQVPRPRPPLNRPRRRLCWPGAVSRRGRLPAPRVLQQRQARLWLRLPAAPRRLRRRDLSPESRAPQVQLPRRLL